MGVEADSWALNLAPVITSESTTPGEDARGIADVRAAGVGSAS
jgi:hypothetical protein